MQGFLLSMQIDILFLYAAEPGRKARRNVRIPEVPIALNWKLGREASWEADNESPFVDCEVTALPEACR